MADLIREISESWGWIGISPEKVIGENDFGNLIIRDVNGSYWRLCPEDLYCRVVAESRAELDELSRDQEFLRDWYMHDLTRSAREALGELQAGRKYCFAIPGALGGAYDLTNLKSLPIVELIRLSGDLAKQIRHLPDGEQIDLKVVD